MLKKSLIASVLGVLVCVSPIFSCYESSSIESLAIVQEPSHQLSQTNPQDKLINDIWIAAKTTNPWLASGAVSLTVFVMLYSSNESFRKKVRSICGLSDDCPCVNVVAKK